MESAAPAESVVFVQSRSNISALKARLREACTMVVTDAERKSEYTPAQIKAIKKHVNAFAHQIARQMELFMAVGAPVAPKPAKNAQPEEAVDEKLEQQARESSAAVKAQCADLLELRRRVPEFIRRVMAQAFRVRAEVVKHSFAEPEHGMAGLPAREDIAQADANLKSLVAHMATLEQLLPKEVRAAQGLREYIEQREQRGPSLVEQLVAQGPGPAAAGSAVDKILDGRANSASAPAPVFGKAPSQYGGDLLRAMRAKPY